MKLPINNRFVRRLALILASSLLLLAVGQRFAAGAPGDGTHTGAAPLPAQPRVYKLYYRALPDLQVALTAANADVLGVDVGERFAAVLMADESADALRQLGYRVEQDELHSRQQLSEWSTQYYTYGRMVTDLVDLSARFPSLATLNDLGPSWETLRGLANRRVWALRIAGNPGAAPQVLFVADQHAREIATPEIAMRLAKHLLEGYGVDPEATFLVDNRDIWIVPMANPDGHVRVEQGSSMKRKNANTDYGSCVEPDWGIDLNRNFPYMWGLAGADPAPCGETYRGPSSGSEPEAQAIMTLVNASSFALLMDYHSFGNLVLWPWGYTTGTSGIDPKLPALGLKLAQLTGRSGSSPYTPEQGSSLYLTSGSLLDWAYAAKGALAFTIEMGSYSDWFDPPYSRVDSLWAENSPPALYLLNVADDPARVYGPEARDARATPALVALTTTITITATLSDSGNGGQNIAAAELFVDSPGANGTGAPMSPGDGSFDSPTETVRATLPSSALTFGRHTLFVRGRDAAGNWGSLAMASIQVQAPYHTYLPTVRVGN